MRLQVANITLQSTICVCFDVFCIIEAVQVIIFQMKNYYLYYGNSDNTLNIT